MERYRAQAEERLAALDQDTSADEPAKARQARRVADSVELARFVDDVAAACDRVEAADSWAAVATALRETVVAFLGGPRTVDRWGPSPGTAGTDRWVTIERAGYEGTLAAVEALRLLDGVDRSAPSLGEVRQALAQELARPLPSGTTLGRGVEVTPVRDLVGADLDLLVILGMTEEAFPPRLRDHPILGDPERRAVGGGLALLDDRRQAERRDYRAAVDGARHVVLSCPRADTRAQRAQHPSPWFMEAVTRLNGSPVESDKLADLDVPWLVRHDSFVSALGEATVPLSTAEQDIRLALSGQAQVLADVDARYARGRAAVQARSDGDFGPWLGGVGPLPEPLASRIEASRSATALQTWATCPLSFLLEHVLHVRDLEDPGEEDTVDPRDKGSLVHDVLQAFLADQLGDEHTPGRSPDEPWTAAETTRASALLDEHADALEATGRTGRPLLWRAQRARLHRQLARILAVDSRLRATRRSWPIAVEEPFGRKDRPPLELHLERSGPVSFAGYIDRVDATESGELLVLDYKTGKGYGYDAIPEPGKQDDETDLVDRGRKLQLVLYALAARQRHGTPETPVEAYFWFVELGERLRGAPVGPTEEHRLLDVLDTAVAGIRGGVFPANPGGWDAYRGWENCTYCAYHRVCPSGRSETWAAVSTDDAVADYARLTDPTPPGDETS